MARWRWLILLIGAFWLGTGVAAAQTQDAAGRWALRADGRILAVLELNRDAQAAGGWTGAWIRPERLTISQTRIAMNIIGPVVRRPILSATPRGGGIDLVIAGRNGEEPDVQTFTVTGPNRAELALRDWPQMPALALERVDAATEVASDWEAGRDYALAMPPRPSNPEMTAIFAADQADRQGDQIDWAVVRPRDEARRARTLALLNSGALQSGEDFYHAAFLFQHGGDPNSYLMAHTLAVIAAARGRPDATWIAAATLDRYLQSIGQKQIYGTQFISHRGQSTTQEPYDRTLVSDALRQALGVPAQADQERQRAEHDAEAARAADGERR